MLPDDPYIVKWAWLYALVLILAIPTFGILAWRLAERLIPQRLDRILIALVFGIGVGVTGGIFGLWGWV